MWFGIGTHSLHVKMTQGCTQTGIQFVYAPYVYWKILCYVYWKMVVYQNGKPATFAWRTMRLCLIL